MLGVAMPSRRAQKAAEAIREVVGMAILADLKDPRIRDVTVTYGRSLGDLRRQGARLGDGR